MIKTPLAAHFAKGHYHGLRPELGKREPLRSYEDKPRCGLETSVGRRAVTIPDWAIFSLATVAGNPGRFFIQLSAYTDHGITHHNHEEIWALVKKKPPNEGGLEGYSSTPHNLPKLRDLRKAIKAEAEREYFELLLILSDGAMLEACRIAGLSTARFYALRRKYWQSITTPKLRFNNQD